MLKFFDAHTHVNLAAFRNDYKETIARAFAVGVGMVNVGTQKDTSLRAVEIAREYPNGIYAAVGLHPVHTGKSFHDADELGGGEEAKSFTSRGETFDYEYYKKLALDPKVVAIGECGLDYFRIENDEAKEKQKTAFLEQIKLAYEVKKPLMIHCRSAFPELIDLLTTHHDLLINPPGIIHFFSGINEEAEKLLKMGFYFTFGGAITYPPKKGGADYAEIIRIMPLDRILSETDAPYVAPAPYRGRRNEPAYVVEVAKKLAELKNLSLEIMTGQIIGNVKKIFKLG